MKADGGGEILTSSRGSTKASPTRLVAKMKEQFIQAGAQPVRVGVVLVGREGRKIAVTETPNGETPEIHGGIPIWCDVWQQSPVTLIIAIAGSLLSTTSSCFGVV